jgi:hypothetical protein
MWKQTMQKSGDRRQDWRKEMKCEDEDDGDDGRTKKKTRVAIFRESVDSGVTPGDRSTATNPWCDIVDVARVNLRSVRCQECQTYDHDDRLIGESTRFEGILWQD